MRVLFTRLLIGCAFMTAAPALAWPSAAGWDIGETDSSCGMSMEFEGDGETHLVLLRDTDDQVFVVIDNANWTAREGERYEIRYALNGSVYSGGAIGTGKSYERKGFISKFGPEFLADFAAASSLRVLLGENLVDQLSLKGSNAALAVVNRCLAALKVRLAADQHERDRLAHIPKDPFATAGPIDPIPLSDRTTWVTPDDYPPAALRELRQGTVQVELTIDTTGMVSDCRVKGSSGSLDLDQRACQVMRRKARFKPARDALGEPVEGKSSQTIHWSIPN